MKKLSVSFIALLLFSAATAQVPAIYYDFEDNLTRLFLENATEQALTAGNSSVARVSPFGGLLLQTAGAARTLYSGSAAGVGLSSAGWPQSSADPGEAATEYLQLTVNTTDLFGLTLSVDVDRSSNSQSPKKLGILWSADGTHFSPALTAPQNIAGNYSSLTFGLPPGAENQTSLTLRIYAYNSSSTLAALSFDNLLVSASILKGVKTLFDFSAYGLSLASGTANTVRIPGSLLILGSGTAVTLNSKLNLGGSIYVGPGATFGFGTAGILVGGSEVDLADGSTLQLRSTDAQSALKGNIGSSYLSAFPNATIEYIGNGLPQHQDAATLSSVVVNNPNGLVLAGDVVINGNLNLKNGLLSGGANKLTISGNITRTNGTLNAAGTELVLNGSAVQNIAAGVLGGTLKKLNSSNAVGVILHEDLSVTDSIKLTAGNLQIGSNKLTLSGPVARDGITQTGSIEASAGSIVLNGTAAQNIADGTFTSPLNYLTVSNAAGVTLKGNTAVSNTLELKAGTLSIDTASLTISGTITQTTGRINAAAGTLVFNGSAAQNLAAGLFLGNLKNLTVSNAAGVTLNEHTTVTGALALQAGWLGLNDKTLTLGGTVSGAGAFRGSAASGLTVASATPAGTLHFDQTTDGATNALSLLTVSSGGATLGSKLNLYTGLNVAGGTLDLDAKNLVLKSTPAQTAYVAEIRGGLTGETNVTVERYSPAWSSRRWRLLTSPLLNTTINAAWQEGSKWNGSAALPANGYGTLITGQTQGSAATANGNGFDFWSAIAGGSASIRTYTPGTSFNSAIWNNLTSTLTPGAFDQNEAYLLFIRGDRSVATGSLAGSTTLRPNGKLKKGSFTIAVSPAKSHTLLGNPYASPLDFKAVYDANNTKIQPYFWIWQSSLGTGNGGYVLVLPVAPGSSLYEAIPGNGSQSAQNRLIQSGEGFFVVPKPGVAADNAITLQEAHKSTGKPSVSVFREMDLAPAKLYVNLLTGPDSAKILLDGALSQYSNTFQADGGTTLLKATNAGENLAIQKNSSDLVVASSVVPTVADTLKLHVWGTTAKDYQLEVRTASLSTVGMSALLVDRYLNQETSILTNDAVTTYSFKVNADVASRDPNRFFVVLKSSPVLPLSLSGLSAAEKNGTITVQWKVTDESGIKAYRVERSTDGTNFRTLAYKQAKASSGEQTYDYPDQEPAATNYYRIQLLGTTGESKYSSVVKVQLQKGPESVRLYPNPVVGTTMNLQFVSKPQGTYELTLYTITGQRLFSKTIRHSGGNATEMLSTGAIAAGNYRLEVKDAGGKTETLNLRVQQ